MQTRVLSQERGTDRWPGGGSTEHLSRQEESPALAGHAPAPGPGHSSLSICLWAPPPLPAGSSPPPAPAFSVSLSEPVPCRAPTSRPPSPPFLSHGTPLSSRAFARLALSLHPLAPVSSARSLHEAGLRAECLSPSPVVEAKSPREGILWERGGGVQHEGGAFTKGMSACLRKTPQ